jgi:hypothetical protein
MRIVKASVVQLSPILYSREGTVDKIVRKIHALFQHYRLSFTCCSFIARSSPFVCKYVMPQC